MTIAVDLGRKASAQIKLMTAKIENQSDQGLCYTVFIFQVEDQPHRRMGETFVVQPDADTSQPVADTSSINIGHISFAQPRVIEEE